MTQSGRLRKKSTIQNSTDSQDTFGDTVKVWEDFAVVRWASVEPLSGREFFSGQQNTQRIDTRFALSYPPTLQGVKSNMRVVFDGENYNIESALNINQRNKELQLMCTRITT